MQDKRLIYNHKLLNITIQRLCQQLIEEHKRFEETVILGLQPRGIFLAKKIRNSLTTIFGEDIRTGTLDVTFNRDDFRRRDAPITPNNMDVPFSIENKKVVLVDDVLYTGRSVRAAMETMLNFGRPARVELLVLINRKYSRDLPIEPTYIGRNVTIMQSEKVLVELEEQTGQADNVWLITQETS